MRTAGLTRPGRTLNRKEKRTVTNRLTQPNAKAPSLGSIVYNGTLGVLASVATVWVLWGAQTDREYAGAALGAMLALGLLASALMNLIVRSEVRMRVRRQALETALEEKGYTPEDGRAWLEREPGSPFYKPGPY
jgi:hypothetical protein